MLVMVIDSRPGQDKHWLIKLSSALFVLWLLFAVHDRLVSRKGISMRTMTSSNGNILLDLCAGNSPVTGEFPAQRPVTRSLIFFYMRLKKRLRKQLWGRRSLWRHCNDLDFSRCYRISTWLIVRRVNLKTTTEKNIAYMHYLCEGVQYHPITRRLYSPAYTTNVWPEIPIKPNIYTWYLINEHCFHNGNGYNQFSLR